MVFVCFLVIFITMPGIIRKYMFVIIMRFTNRQAQEKLMLETWVVVRLGW